jgi:hypothetical protein
MFNARCLLVYHLNVDIYVYKFISLYSSELVSRVKKQDIMDQKKEKNNNKQ